MDAISPTTTVEAFDESGEILFTMHERHVFIKSYGAVDEGHQILVCTSNRVQYVAKVLVDGGFIVGGVYPPDIDVLSFSETLYSQYYGGIDCDANGNADVVNDQYGDRSEMIEHAAKAFWNYRHYGTTNFQIQHLITKFTFEWAGEKKTTFNVPYIGAYWTY